MAGCDLMVTGARGFVGRHLLAAAEAAGAEVCAFEGDLRDRGATLDQVRRLRPRRVAHLAAPPRRAGGDAWDAVVGELELAAPLLAALTAEVPGSTVLLVGSAAQYGMAPERPLTENDPTDPVSPYGACKCVLERAATARALTGEVNVIFARSFNHVGPGQGEEAPVPQWARQVAAAERAGGGELVTGRTDVVRDFLDVRDVAQAYLALLQLEAPAVVNVCSGRPVLLQQVIDGLLGHATSPVEHRRDPALERAVDPPYVVGDPGLLNRLTGWAPTIPIEQSVRDVLEEWRAAEVAS